MTEREKILMQRTAFMLGVSTAVTRGKWEVTPKYDEMEKASCERYPLPMVTRPREVDDPHNSAYRFRLDPPDSGKPFLHYSVNGGEWTVCTGLAISAERVAVWLDLFDRPTERVLDESESSPSLPGASS